MTPSLDGAAAVSSLTFPNASPAVSPRHRAASSSFSLDGQRWRSSGRAQEVGRNAGASMVGLPRLATGLRSMEDHQVSELVRMLDSHNVEEKRKATKNLGLLATKDGMTTRIASHAGSLARRLHDNDEGTRKFTLEALRILSENGEARVVGLHARDIVACLKDEDVILRRKAAALCRVIAEEGGATYLAVHVPRLMECFQGSLVTPLDALRAMADAGEASSVSHSMSQLVRALSDNSCRIRGAACDTLATIGRSGGGELMRRLRMIEQANRAPPRGHRGEHDEGSGEPPILEALTSLVLKEEDSEVQSSAVRALYGIVTLDTESWDVLRERHSFQLVQVLCQREGKLERDVTKMLQEILGMDEGNESRELSEDSGSELDDERADREVCVICLRGLQASNASTAMRARSRRLECQHVFHKCCLDRWFSSSRQYWGKKTCPICRWEAPRFGVQRQRPPSGML